MQVLPRRSLIRLPLPIVEELDITRDDRSGANGVENALTMHMQHSRSARQANTTSDPALNRYLVAPLSERRGNMLADETSH